MYTKVRKRVACVIPPYYRLIESKNNRLTPAMHYVAEILYRRGHEVILINGDYAEDSYAYADRMSITLNSWLFTERYKHGHESYDEVMKALTEFKPDIVFLGAGDVLMPTVEIGSAQSCAFLARKIKAVLGEQTVCVGYGHLLRYARNIDLENMDVVIAGEAEEYIADIVEGGLRGVLPVSWGINMDSLPILTDEYILHRTKPEDWDYIMSMRGCPNRCTFCYQPSMRGYNIACMSPERFIREIYYRIEKFGTKSFYFTDMIFVPGSGTRTIEMLDRLIQLKKDYPDFNWWAEFRVDMLNNKEIIDKMKASGCRHMKFGVEMANQDMLNTVKKGISLKDIKKAFEMTAEMGIERTAYVLLGCPGFSDEDYKAMWKFFSDLKAENYVININVPYIGTELYETVKNDLCKHGIYQEGEEGFIHTSLVMKNFWRISDETIKMYFSLQGKKDDSYYRNYKRKVVNRVHYFETGEIEYSQEADESHLFDPEICIEAGS